MMAEKSPIEMMEIVAKGFGDLLENVVFVGGAATSLYCVDHAAQSIRPTKDVDCIVKPESRMKFHEFEKDLSRRGFRHDITQGAPLCRWIYNDVIVDIMPIDEEIFGFSNKWYAEGMTNATTANLPSGQDVSILTLPYFIATKIEAYKNRGEGDYRMSQDIEDIIIVLDSQVVFDNMYQAPDSVKQYLKQEFRSFVGDEQFLESVSGYLGYVQTSTGRAIRVIDFMREYSEMK